MPTLYLFPNPITVDSVFARVGVASYVFGFVLSVIQAFLIAPLAIAVHRFVLLGEVTNGYSLDLSNPRYLRFVGCAVVLNLLATVPVPFGYLVYNILRGIYQEPIAAFAGTFFVTVVLTAIITIAVLRQLILFPAIAVDAPGAGWSNARKDTLGHTWRVLFISICTTIPTLVVSLPFVLLFARPPGPSGIGQFVLSVVHIIVAVPALCAYVAAVSHLFRALADNLARPPGPAASAT